MAKRNLPTKSKQVNKAKRSGASKSRGPSGPKWSDLKPDTKRKYKAAGVTPAKFNAWRDPKVKAKAKREGIPRWEFLGLRSKHQISGGSDSARRAAVFAMIKVQFGDAEHFSASGTHAWLSNIEGDELRYLAGLTSSEIYELAYVASDEDFGATRNGSGIVGRELMFGDKRIESAGYLFYH